MNRFENVINTAAQHPATDFHLSYLDGQSAIVRDTSLPGAVVMQGTVGCGKSAPAALTPTWYELYFDDTKRKPWSFALFDDDGHRILSSEKQYKTKPAAASAAVRKLK